MWTPQPRTRTISGPFQGRSRGSPGAVFDARCSSGAFPGGTLTTTRSLAPRRLARALALIVATGFLLARPPGAESGAGQPRTPGHHNTSANGINLVVFLVDDMDDISCRETKDFLPRSSRWLRGQGRCYEDASVSSPVCCPSRAVLHTAQLPHNNGVRRQVDAGRLRVRNSLQYVLSQAGMTTYGTGKLFNGVAPWAYESGDLVSGFDSSDFWPGSAAYGYKIWSDELQKPIRPAEEVHATVRAGDNLTSFVTRMSESEEPFYAYVGFKAPHTNNAAATPAGRLPTPTPANAQRPVPTFDWDPERDTSDKLPVFQRRLPGRGYYQRLYRARVRSMYDVDDQMARAFRLLEETGLLTTTAVIFSSDNGYHLGQNGWETKGAPYRPSVEVPLLAYYPPGFGTGVVDRREVQLMDVAPTLYELLDVEPGHVMDGHSMLGEPKRTRGSVFEYSNDQARIAEGESGVTGSGLHPALVPNWAMYRWGKRSYIEFYEKDGSLLRREFYADLWQLKNLLNPQHAEDRPSRQVLRRFKQLLANARECAGTREAGSRHFCP